MVECDIWTGYDNYGNRINGLFTPTNDDYYVFILNANDDADLFLSTDASPLNKVKIAGGGAATANALIGKWSVCTNTWRSDTYTDPVTQTKPFAFGIPLLHGQQYYFEVVHHESGSADWAQVTYKTTSESDPTDGALSRMAGSQIGFYAPLVTNVWFVQQPANATATSGNPVTFTALGTNYPTYVVGTNNTPASVLVGTTGNPQYTVFTNKPFAMYQWYKNGTLIPGATSGSYTVPNVLPSDQGAQFYCKMRSPGYADGSLNPIWSNSLAATLTVVTDSVPPTISYAATLRNTNRMDLYIVDITFSEKVDSATALNPLRYTIGGVNITNVSMSLNGKTIELLLDVAPTLPLNISVTGVKDLSGNTIVAASTAPIIQDRLNLQDIGPSLADPAYPSYITVTGTNSYIISSEGSDLYVANDACGYAWELKTNSFDVIVRGVYVEHSQNYAKAGLLVRESLASNSRMYYTANDPVIADRIQAPDGSGYGATQVEAVARLSNNVNTVVWTVGTTPVPQYPNAWLRLKRTYIDGTNDIIRAMYSTNGVDWVLRGERKMGTNYVNYVTNTLPNPQWSNVVYVGLFSCGHNNDRTVAPLPPPFQYYNRAQFADYNSDYVQPMPASPTLTVTDTGTNTVLVSWVPAGGFLWATTNVGPTANWQSLGSGNPAVVQKSSNTRFFRVASPYYPPDSP